MVKFSYNEDEATEFVSYIKGFAITKFPISFHESKETCQAKLIKNIE